jgi:competence protein ComFC
VEKIMAPLLAGVLGASRFEVVAGAAAPRGLGRGGFNPIELMSRGEAGRIEAPFLDKLKAVSRTRNQVELSAVKRWALTRHEGLWRENLLVDDVFTSGATVSECSGVFARRARSRFIPWPV